MKENEHLAQHSERRSCGFVHLSVGNTCISDEDVIETGQIHLLHRKGISSPSHFPCICRSEHGFVSEDERVGCAVCEYGVRLLSLLKSLSSICYNPIYLQK